MAYLNFVKLQTSSKVVDLNLKRISFLINSQASIFSNVGGFYPCRSSVLVKLQASTIVLVKVKGVVELVFGHVTGFYLANTLKNEQIHWFSSSILPRYQE